MQKVYRITLWALLTLLLLPSAGFAASPEKEDPAAYVARLEEAVEACHGAPDAWPWQLHMVMASTRYFSGVDTGAVQAPAGCPEELAALMDRAITPDGPGSPEDVAAYLTALDESMYGAFGNGCTWSYALFAALTALEAYAGREGRIYEYGLPGPDDIQLEEAVALAQRAVQGAYHLTNEEMDALETYARFDIDAYFLGTPYWYVIMGLNDQGYERYYAVVSSPDGEVLRAERNDGNG